MKKIVKNIGLLLAFLVASSGILLSNCEQYWWNETGVCLEIWCVNAGGNVGLSCLCGTAMRYDCPGGDQ